MKRKGTLAALTFSALVSCDCVREATGLVCDADTREGIPGATIKDAAGFHPGSVTGTDHVGRYGYRDISGGIFRCPPLRLAILAPGYVTKTVTFASFGEQDTLLLKRSAP